MKNTELINYLSVENWHEFMRTKITPIRNYGQAIVSFWEFLKDLDGWHIDKVLREYPRLNVVFLGGVGRDGYRENSFAEAIKVMFGAKITDLKAYFSFVAQNLDPVVPIEVEKTEILKCIELIRDVANLIIDKAGVDVEENDKLQEEYVNNPDKIFEGLLKFLQHCVNVCVGFDEYMTFVWNIRKITKRYLNLIFPETKEDENFKFLREFLGFTELFVPEVDDASLRDEYTVYGFPDIYVDVDTSESFWKENWFERCSEIIKKAKTIGGLLLWLNRFVWRLTCEYYYHIDAHHGHEDELKKVLGVDNLVCPLYKYLGACKERLDRLNWKKDNVFLYNFFKDCYGRCMGIIDGTLIKNKNGLTVSRLFGFLDQIAPALFLGVYELVFVDKNKFILIKR